jgi:pimeloyl-ACP methyl ester carboxylesterase
LTERSFEVGSTRLNAAVGPANGPPLVFFHGVTRRWQSFVPVLHAFLPRWQVFVVDFPGHGASDRVESSYLVVDYLNWASEFLERYVSGDVYLYGHSLGSMVAAGCAARLSSVKGIVLEDPPFDVMGSQIATTPLLGYFTELLHFAGSPLPVGKLVAELAEVRMGAFGSMNTFRLGDIRDAVSLRFTASSLKRLDPKVLQSVVARNWLTGYERDAILKAITCPTLLLQGDIKAGGMLPDADADEVIARLADGALMRFPGIGHLIHWARPQDVINAALGFLEAIR